ncbi:hypothetical protein CL648_02470 [bacterium]|nr:hypothetical protein [bacterium]|tara:strand:- start:226 stop:1116 length:891 start_codon:yes stop_codon:yes gene_type:complete
MTKTAYINGILIGDDHNERKINILIENGIVTGKGYLPDETDADIALIDCKNCYILPHILGIDTDPQTPNLTGTIGPVGHQHAYPWIPISTLLSQEPTANGQPVVGVSVTLNHDTVDAVNQALSPLSHWQFPIIVRWGAVFDPTEFQSMMTSLERHNRPIFLEAVTTGQMLATALTAKKHIPAVCVSASLDAFFESDSAYFIEALKANVIDHLYATITPEDTILLAFMIARLTQLPLATMLSRITWDIPQFFGITDGLSLGKPAQCLIVDPDLFMSVVQAKHTHTPIPDGFIRTSVV